jgi:hypothetical protein
MSGSRDSVAKTNPYMSDNRDSVAKTNLFNHGAYEETFIRQAGETEW